MHTAIAARRRLNQRVTRPDFTTPADVVRWLGAVQAQEYPAARWGLGLRMATGVRDVDIQRAFDEGRILRTHVMRPTWHFVTPADIRWMLELTAPRVHRVMSSYLRRLELDPPLLTRAAAAIERALSGGEHLTRSELGVALQRAGIAVAGTRLAMVMMYAELEAVVCSGPRRDKQFTYALLATRAPRSRRLSGDEALAELTRRYFTSHGPATIRDCVWWSGLRTPDVRRGLEMNRARPESIDGLTFWTVSAPPVRSTRRAIVDLLPIYDEYIVAYRDRGASPQGAAIIRTQSGREITFQHALVVRGSVTGTWKTIAQGERVMMDVIPLRPLSADEILALQKAVTRYGRFLEREVSLRITV